MYGVAILIAVAAIAFSILFAIQSGIPLVFAANQIAPNVVATATVPLSCAISLNPSTGFNFANTVPGSNTVTLPNSIVDTNGGNAGTVVWIYGGNWIGGGSSFGVTNTVWSVTTATGYGVANQLTLTNSNTALVIAASGGANSIFFGLAVPTGQAANTYTQNVVITNVC